MQFTKGYYFTPVSVLARCPLIGTLGPSGTSSEQAALHYAKNILPSYLNSNIKLYNSFEIALEKLLDNELAECVVPHAYQKINQFYINKDLKLHFVFQHATPEYGLAQAKDRPIDRNIPVRIATHHAPSHLINDKSLVPWDKVTVIDASSTSIAADMLEAGECDLAITNAKAISKHGDKLSFLSTYGEIEMDWSVFARRHAQ